MEGKKEKSYVYPIECRSMHVGVNNYSACGVKAFGDLMNAQKDAKDLETTFKEQLKFHKVMRFSDQNYGIRAYEKFKEYLANWTIYFKEAANADKPIFFCLTFSCHGIMYNGETLAVFPNKLPSGTVELQFVNIEQIARDFSLIKNLYTLVFFDGCRNILEERQLHLLAGNGQQQQNEEAQESQNIINLKQAAKQAIHPIFDGVSVIVYTVPKGQKVNEAKDSYGTPQFIQYIIDKVIGNKQYGWKFLKYFAQYQVNSNKPMITWQNVQIFYAKTKINIERLISHEDSVIITSAKQEEEKKEEEEKAPNIIKNNIEIQRSMIQTEDCLLINQQKLYQSYDYLRVFHQLQRNGNIICCGNYNKLIKLYDQFTLQSTQSINVNNVTNTIFAILEHKQYLFICDYNYTVFMIDNNNYNVIDTYCDTNTGLKYSIEIVNDNTLIIGTGYGYLCLYDIVWVNCPKYLQTVV